jgi:hypothetical protein
MHGVQPEHETWLKVLCQSAAVGKQRSTELEVFAAQNNILHHSKHSHNQTDAAKR